MNVADPILVDTITKLFSSTCSHEAVQAAESTGWAADIWEPLAGTGAPWVGVPVEAGGSGGNLADAIAVVRLGGRFAAPLPIAETGLLGGWLLAAAGIVLPDGPVTVVPERVEDQLRLDGAKLSGTLHRVPWAAAASRIVALVDGQVLAIDPRAAGVEIRPTRNLAGEPRETVVLDGVTVAERGAAPEGVNAIALRQRGALVRGAQIAGALDRIGELTVSYANQRQQFGQKIARFQAVAQHLVRLVSEIQMVNMALDGAVAAAEAGEATFEIASLKVLAGDAGSEVVARAHQVHGAIGMTQEFVLHQLTRRVWAWREEFGSTSWWRNGLGQLVADVGADGLWPLISEGSAALVG
jgi:acyl-CoA dehydrogenase